jgi:hypothetical protein
VRVACRVVCALLVTGLVNRCGCLLTVVVACRGQLWLSVLAHTAYAPDSTVRNTQ